MEKKFWGPSTWCMIHTAATGYKDEYRYSFKQFIYSLPYLLPCEYCRQHLFQNLRILPINDDTVKSPQSLFTWSYLLHDHVNKQLHKKPSPSYILTQKYYFDHLHDNNFWGPCFWRALHSFAAAYRPTPAVQTAFKQFVYSWTGIIPCKACREHYTYNLNNIPLSEKFLKNAHNLFLWSYLLHDITNKQLGKESPPYEEVKAQYFNDNVCSSCGVDTTRKENVTRNVQ